MDKPATTTFIFGVWRPDATRPSMTIGVDRSFVGLFDERYPILKEGAQREAMDRWEALGHQVNPALVRLYRVEHWREDGSRWRGTKG